MINGHWVTLHIQHLGGGEDRTLLGFLVQDGSTPGYKLTKLATTKAESRATHMGVQASNARGGIVDGITTTIHEGVWIVAPHFVWLIEYEESAPVAGFSTTEV